MDCTLGRMGHRPPEGGGILVDSDLVAEDGAIGALAGLRVERTNGLTRQGANQLRGEAFLDGAERV